MRPRLFATLVFLFTAPLFAQRLPLGVHPLHYALNVTPNLKSASFAGSETIDVLLDHASKTVTLNAVELEINTVRAGSQTAIVSYDSAKEQATFTFAEPLPAGPVTLSIAYTGTLNDKLRGFYLSRTAKRNYAVTQFEATDARRAFPCFDEPALKATFDLSLTIDKGDTVIANTNMLTDKPAANGMHTQTFARTPKMSTYLLAFQVGDWVCSKGEADGIPIRSCSTPDKLAFTPYALHAAEHFLHFYDQYFGVKYAMPKLDMIGIPDFEAGAMENWGCITYREKALLLDEKSAPLSARKLVAIDVAHEMAHQWFGDLVTMQWWDNLWLNEGFATWMEYKAVGEWQPAWDIPADAARDLNSTLDLDASPQTRTIRSKADTPDEINEQFDGISYGKAGAVIGMVEHYLGGETFQQGVHNYMEAHKFANATAEDFWNAQAAVSGKPADKIMASFVDQPGVPLLQAQAVDSDYTFEQGRFFLSPPASRPGQTWTIPVCVRGGSCQVISAKAGVLKLPPDAVPALLEDTEIINAGAKGYYRSGYDQATLGLLLSHVETLSPPERVLLTGDRYAFMRAGQVTAGSYMDMVATLRGDPSPQVLEQSLAGLNSISGRVANDAERNEIKAWIRQKFGPVYRSLGPARGESLLDSQRRADLFGLLGMADDPAIVAESRRITTRSVHGDRSIDPQLAQAALPVAAAHGDAALYDGIESVSKSGLSPARQTEALFALAEFDNPQLATRTLRNVSAGKIRNQDSWVLLSELLSQPETRDLTWNYMKNNWNAVHTQFTTSSGNRVVSATGAFCTKEAHADVQQFFAAHPVEASERALRDALDRIDSCVQFRAEQQGNLQQWLTANH